ncbi:MAG TPA: hypothetical protein ENJ95_21150 [Bacteroidetes bacterium]|nr:hypothetical protein [Bacteroidota bacterium]
MREKKNQLKDLLADDLQQFFLYLKEQLAEGSRQENKLRAYEGQYHRNDEKWNEGQITKEDHNIENNRIANGLLDLIDDLTPEDFKPDTSADGPKGIGEYHRYTCDRIDQEDLFRRHFNQKKSEKAHFFYLYGMELQSHKGLFRRIAFDLEERLQDYLNPDFELSCHSLQVELTFRPSNDIEIYKQNFLKNLMAALSVSVNEQEPILEKNLQWLREESPSLQKLSGRDYACIFVGISERSWSKEITPEATRWFIEKFCGGPFPDDFPKCLFFFAVIYEEDGSKIEKEVEEVIENSELVTPLPELGMVNMDDLKDWFTTYDFIASSGRELRELRNKHFGGEEEHYMDDVEFELKKIIKNYNQKFY